MVVRGWDDGAHCCLPSTVASSQSVCPRTIGVQLGARPRGIEVGQALRVHLGLPVDNRRGEAESQAAAKQRLSVQPYPESSRFAPDAQTTEYETKGFPPGSRPRRRAGGPSGTW